MSQKKIDISNDEEVFHNIFVPTFLEKCAALGFPAKSTEDAQEMLNMAARLDVMDTQESNNLLKSASAELAKRVPGVEPINAQGRHDSLMARAAEIVG